MSKHKETAQHVSSYSGRGFIILLLLFSGFLTAASSGIKPWLVITNTTSFIRTNEVIAVKRHLLGNVHKNLIPVIRKKDAALISQTVDEDKDGIWDNLLVEVTIGAHATDTFEVVWVGKDAEVSGKPFTGVRLSLRSENAVPSAPIHKAVRFRGFTQNIAKPYYQMEGPGIENDKVAFRAFFDSRNGKDIYGKTVDTPVLEKVGVGATWHEMQPWGMDILKVGNSLGAGALAIEEDNRIYRLADADTAVFQSLYAGALQAAFDLNFTGWDVGTGKRTGSETVSVTKGAFCYKNDIRLALHMNQHLMAGIANFGVDTVVYKKHNASFSSISTYGKQAEGTQTNLGLAIMFSSGDYMSNKTADTASVIPNTSYVVLKRSPGNKKVIYLFACWEKTDPRFHTQQGFNDYLQRSAQELAHPIQVKLIRKKQ